MSTETFVVVIFLALVTLVTSFWYARRIDRQHAQAADVLSRSASLQDREAELLTRWEVVVGRLERAPTGWSRVVAPNERLQQTAAPMPVLESFGRSARPPLLRLIVRPRRGEAGGTNRLHELTPGTPI